MLTLSPSRERATLLVLAAVQFTHVMDFMIMMPLGPQLMSAFSIGPADFASIVASYGFSAGVCGFVASFVLDRFDRKRSLLWLFAGFALATLSCGLSQNYWMLLVSRVLAGAFGGVAGSVVTASVSDVVPPERRGRGMAFVMSGFSLAQIFGVPIGLYLTEHGDWHAPFLVLAGVAVVVNVAGIQILPRIVGHVGAQGTQSSWSRVREILSNANHLRAFGLVAMLTMSGMVVVPFLAAEVEHSAVEGRHAVILVYACGGVATLVFNNLFGHLGDRFGHVRVFDAIALFAIAPVLVVTSLGSWPLALIVTVTTLFMISMGGRWTPAMALVTMSVESRVRGGFMNLNSAIQALFGAVAAKLSGTIVTESLDGGIEHFIWAGVASLVFLGVATILIHSLRIVDLPEKPVPSPEPESGALD